MTILLLRFLHFLGMALWLGGAFAAMTLATAARSASERPRLWPLLARLNGSVIAPGAVLTILTGLALTMLRAMGGQGAMLGRPGIILMQTLGLVAALLALAVGLPTAQQLGVAAARVTDGTVPEGAERLRRRQSLVSSISGALALLALFFGVVVL